MAGRQGPFGWTTQPKRSATPPGVFLAVPSPLRCGFRRRSLRRPFRNFVLGKSLCKKSWSPTLIRRSKQEVSCVKPKTAVFPPCCPRYWSRRTTTPVSDGSRRWRNPRAAGICCSAGRPQRIWKKQSAACCRRVRGLSSWSGTLCGKLFLYLLAFRSGQEASANAEQRDSLYYENGILCDSISSQVTQVGLVLPAGMSEHPAYRLLRQAHELCRRSISVLCQIQCEPSSAVYTVLCFPGAQHSAGRL